MNGRTLIAFGLPLLVLAALPACRPAGALKSLGRIPVEKLAEQEGSPSAPILILEGIAYRAPAACLASCGGRGGNSAGAEPSGNSDGPQFNSGSAERQGSSDGPQFNSGSAERQGSSDGPHFNSGSAERQGSSDGPQFNSGSGDRTGDSGALRSGAALPGRKDILCRPSCDGRRAFRLSGPVPPVIDVYVNGRLHTGQPSQEVDLDALSFSSPE